MTSALQIIFLAFFVVVVPILAIGTARRVKRGMPTPPRESVFLGILVSQLVFLGLALVVARHSAISLWPVPTWNPIAAAIAGAIFSVLIIGLALRGMLIDHASDRALEIILPHTKADLPMFALVCLVVGISEEVVFRGVMMQIIEPRVASWWLAVGLCTCVFALSHCVQGGWSMLVVVLVTIALHLLVRESGNLYWAITIHALYDFLAGVAYVMVIRPRLVRQASPAVAKFPAKSENAAV